MHCLSVVPVTLSTAICSGLFVPFGPAILSRIVTLAWAPVTRIHLRRLDSAAAERASEARKTADRLACEAWNKHMLGFSGAGAAVASAGRRP